MVRFTAILVALALTGSPAAAAACARWCGAGLAVIGHCHDEIAANVSPAISNAELTCRPLLTEGAFLRQDERRVSMIALLSDIPAARVGSTTQPGVCGNRGVNQLPPKPPLVLRL